jgi:hypothetical protein
MAEITQKQKGELFKMFKEFAKHNGVKLEDEEDGGTLWQYWFKGAEAILKIKTWGYQMGWDSLAKYSGLSRRTLINQKSKLEEENVIDYILKGRPPKRVMRWHPENYDKFRNKK